MEFLLGERVATLLQIFQLFLNCWEFENLICLNWDFLGNFRLWFFFLDFCLFVYITEIKGRLSCEFKCIIVIWWFDYILNRISGLNLLMFQKRKLGFDFWMWNPCNFLIDCFHFLFLEYVFLLVLTYQIQFLLYLAIKLIHRIQHSRLRQLNFFKY